jgi:hypothetical protein
MELKREKAWNWAKENAHLFAGIEFDADCKTIPLPLDLTEFVKRFLES